MGVRLERRLQKVGFKALGSIITTNGRNITDVEHRIEQFEKAIYANSKTLRSKSAKVIPKLKLFQQIMRQVLFWGSGNWNLTKQHVSRLRGVQQRVLRRIVRVPSHGGIDSDVFAHMARVIRGWTTKAKIEDAAQMYYRLRLEWAGHLARLRDVRPACLTVRVMMWRNRKHLNYIMALNAGSQLHGRRICAWRWEHIICAELGQDWHTMADNREKWQAYCKRRAIALARPLPRCNTSY
jgi:hypothetical protein